MYKKFFVFLFIISSCVTSLCAQENILSVFEKSYTEEKLELCLKNGLEKLGVNLAEEVS